MSSPRLNPSPHLPRTTTTQSQPQSLAPTRTQTRTQTRSRTRTRSRSSARIPSWIPRWKWSWKEISPHLNFYRVHLVLFTIIPLIFSGIFYAANGSAGGNANEVGTGRLKVLYIDSLFLCFSAMSVTGLVTVNVSGIHPFQQVLLFILFILGDYTIVSLVMVLVRKHYFRRHCEQLLYNDRLRRINTRLEPNDSLWSRTFTFRPKAAPPKPFKKGAVISAPVDPRPQDGFVDADRRSQAGFVDADSRSPNGRGQGGNEMSMPGSPTDIRPKEIPAEMRMTDSPAELDSTVPNGSFDFNRRQETLPNDTGDTQQGPTETAKVEKDREQITDSQQSTLRQAPGILIHDQNNEPSRRDSPVTFAWSPQDPPQSHDHESQISDRMPGDESSPWMRRQLLRQKSRALSLGVPVAHVPLYQTPTAPAQNHIPFPTLGQHTGYGGFPSPFHAIVSALPASTKAQMRRRFSRAERHLTIVHNPTTEPVRDEVEQGWGSKAAKWLPESLGGLVIGRNSRFYTEELDDNELEQLGGVEYRALKLLSHIVAGYFIFFQIVPFAILAIYFSKVHDWDSAFQTQLGVQDATVNPSWFSLFQVLTAYTGAGMSLVDQSMVPFAQCYLIIYVVDIVMLVGNHALPMTLRLTIWLATKIWREGTVNESLHFLLDHPRRCFLYLFPSHQTWYLVLILVAFSVVELFGFLVLNIHLPAVSSLSGWELFSDGLLQSLSVRASGFGIVAVADLAPAVLFLYVILMYVAIYPIAMSVRSTNVYEERALGVYEHKFPDALNEEEPSFQGHRGEVFSKYLWWHMRRQLAFDIWPLAIAIFLICIAERGKLLNPETSNWFSVFRIMFECTSAYSTIGLSLGTPNNNYSFSGELSTVSKLIMILVMLRGRHRGLPVAIDRAVMLPREYARIDRRSGDAGDTQDDTPDSVNQNNAARKVA